MKGLALGGHALHEPAIWAGAELLHPVAQAQLTAALFQGGFQAAAQGLHRAVQMPQPEWFLHHRQHRDAIERSGAFGWLLGVELQLKIEKASQPLVLRATAAAQAQQVGHAGQTKDAAGQGGWLQGPHQLLQVPEVARWQHGLPGGKGPVAPVQALAQLPEPFTARELALPLLAPALRVAPDLHRWLSITEIHHAARIQRGGLGQWHPQFGKQALVAATGFKPGHLGGAGIKGVAAAAKGAGTAAALVVGFEQDNVAALAAEQGCSRESGDASADHHNISRGQGVSVRLGAQQSGSQKR